MKPLILILLSILSIFLAWSICELCYPGNDFESVNKWLNIRHAIYVLSIGLAVSSHLFYLNPKYEKITFFISTSYLFGVLVPIFCDKLVGDVEYFHWWDILLVMFGFYCGLKKWFPVQHQVIGQFFIGKRAYNWLIILLK